MQIERRNFFRKLIGVAALGPAALAVTAPPLSPPPISKEEGAYEVTINAISYEDFRDRLIRDINHNKRGIGTKIRQALDR